MKVKVQRNLLFSHLQRTQNIVERKTTLPILSHILMEAQGNSLKLSSTDLEVGVTDICEAELVEEGSTTIQARKFFEIIRELPDKEISLTQKEEQLEIRCGRGLFRMHSLPPDEFPKIPIVETTESIKLPGNMIREMINKVSISICADESRYTLTGILTNMEEKEEGTVFRMITTDGHRLSFCEKYLPEDIGFLSEFRADKDKENRNIILPKKAVQEMGRLVEEKKGDLEFGLHQENAFVRKDNLSMIMRLVQGRFPDYKTVIPEQIEKSMSVDSAALEESLRRVSVLSTEKTKGIKFAVETDKLTVFSNSPELGEAQEELDLSYKGDSFELGFNARYLLDFLQIAKGEIVLEFGADLRPCVFREKEEKDYLYVLMPLRS